MILFFSDWRWPRGGISVAGKLVSTGKLVRMQANQRYKGGAMVYRKKGAYGVPVDTHGVPERGGGV